MERSSHLLDEALGMSDPSSSSSSSSSSSPLQNGAVVVIEDCVETSASFVIHHILKRSLSAANSAVVLVSLSHPFSHYDRILRKLGCNLAAHRDSQRFFFFDMLMLDFPVTGNATYACDRRSGDKHSGVKSKLNCPKMSDPRSGTIDLGSVPGQAKSNISNGGLIELYAKIQKIVEDIAASSESRKCITIILDDYSLIEVAANGSLNHSLDFLRYCYTLTSEFGCSLVILHHEDIYSAEESATLILQMEYLANVLIKAEPLATGLAADVHGQLTVLSKGVHEQFSNSKSKVHNFHFKLRENGVECFYPGTQA